MKRKVLGYLGRAYILSIIFQERSPGILIPSCNFPLLREHCSSCYPYLPDLIVFGEGVVVHISTAEPICPALMDSVHSIAAKEVSERGVHKGMTYGCVEGPRLGTRAESYFLINAGCGLVGMTNIPEAFLAREAQICYASLCVVTDYDSWLDDPTQHVTAEMVLELYGKSLGDVNNVLRHVAVQERNNSCPLCRSLPSALVTPLEDVGAEKRQMMQMLLR